MLVVPIIVMLIVFIANVYIEYKNNNSCSRSSGGGGGNNSKSISTCGCSGDTVKVVISIAE